MTRYTYHCLFEQSGTFKNEFKKLGYEAYDYDVLNDFGETDYVIDLYKEIEKAYDKKTEFVRQVRGGSTTYLLSSLVLDLKIKYICTFREMPCKWLNGVTKENWKII